MFCQGDENLGLGSLFSNLGFCLDVGGHKEAQLMVQGDLLSEMQSSHILILYATGCPKKIVTRFYYNIQNKSTW